MSQDLKDISLEAFQIQLYKIASRELEKLREQIYDIKRSSIGYALMHDLERKETAILRELMRRAYLKHKENPQDLEDYNRQTEKYRNKKRVF